MSTSQPSRFYRLPHVWLLVVPVVAGVAVAATFAFSGGSNSASGAKGTVQIESFSFHPPTVKVAPGAKFTVSNGDGATHTFTAVRGEFNTGDIAGGATKSISAPANAGTYQYRCNIHQYMHGVLTVGP